MLLTVCSSSESDNDTRMFLVGTCKTNIGVGPALIHEWVESVGKSADHATKVDFLHTWRTVIDLTRLIISDPIQLYTT